MRRLLSLLTVAALAACSAPASDALDTAADEQAIRGKVDGLNQALTSQNDSAIGAIYADSAVLLPPGMLRVTGRDSIRKFFAAIWPLKASLTLSPTTVRVSSDWAIEEGNWNWTMPNDRNDHGKYLVSWHRTDGDWLIVQDIWNSDVPPPPTSAAPAARHR